MAWTHTFVFLLFQFIINVALGDSGACFNTTQYIVKETGLGALKFWGSKADDVEQCMKLCVRQKRCQSINYDILTKMCELNKRLRKGGQSKSRRNLYSEYRTWPSKIDPNCFSRLCDDDEVCIPQTLLRSSSTSDCAYSCFPFSLPVRPKQTIGTSNGRTVDSENESTCPKGKTGGGTATGQENLKSDTEIVDGVDIIGHSCTDDTLCSDKGARCMDGKCQCFYSKYDVSSSKCQQVLRLNEGNDNKDTIDGYLEWYHGGEWLTVCSYQWNWEKTISACKYVGSDLIYGGTYHTDWMDGSGSYQNEPTVHLHCLDTSNYQQDCDEFSVQSCSDNGLALTCFKRNFTEPSNSFSLLQLQLSTNVRLFVKINDEWSRVCNTDWTDENTRVTCKSNLRNKRYDKSSQLHNSPRYNTSNHAHNIECDGTEPHLIFCKNSGWSVQMACSDGNSYIECD